MQFRTTSTHMICNVDLYLAIKHELLKGELNMFVCLGL